MSTILCINSVLAPLQPKGKYEVITGTPKSPDELVDMYEALISKYPAVVALIDPLRKEVRREHSSEHNTAVNERHALVSTNVLVEAHGM